MWFRATAGGIISAHISIRQSKPIRSHSVQLCIRRPGRSVRLRLLSLPHYSSLATSSQTRQLEIFQQKIRLAPAGQQHPAARNGGHPNASRSHRYRRIPVPSRALLIYPRLPLLNQTPFPGRQRHRPRLPPPPSPSPTPPHPSSQTSTSPTAPSLLQRRP